MAAEIEIARQSAKVVVGVVQGMLETTRANGDIKQAQRARFKAELDSLFREDVMRHLTTLSQEAIYQTRRNWEAYQRERTGDQLIDQELLHFVFDSAQRMRDLIREYQR